MADADELYTLKNSFYLGNYQDAIAEAETLTRLKTDQLKLEKECYVYRSYCGLGQYKKILKEINDSSSTPLPLLGIRYFALYFADPNNKTIVLNQLETWAHDVTASSTPLIQILSAIIYLQEGAYTPALKAVHTGTTLEALALMIQIYIRMDRLDLAEKTLKLLQEKDDENSLYQISAATLSLLIGGTDRYNEGYSLYQELQQRYGDEISGPANGLAAACICLHRYDDAEKILTELLNRETNNNINIDTRINWLSLFANTNRSNTDTANKYVQQLTSIAPGHPYVSALTIAENSFDRLASSFG